MLGKAISKYAIADEEILAEINTKYPDLNQKKIYEYEKIEAYNQPNKAQNIQTEKENANDNNSITSEDFEVEEENVEADREGHFKDLEKFIGVSMKKTAHVMVSKMLNSINK